MCISDSEKKELKKRVSNVIRFFFYALNKKILIASLGNSKPYVYIDLRCEAYNIVR